jgi:hypothetical protein
MADTARPLAVPADEVISRWHRDSIRGAWWALRVLYTTRRSLRRGELATTVASPPALRWGATRGVEGILRRRPQTCLERSLVLQRWLASHGKRHEVVIGVSLNDKEFSAHAWLDYESGRPDVQKFHELLRMPAL